MQRNQQGGDEPAAPGEAAEETAVTVLWYGHAHSRTALG